MDFNLPTWAVLLDCSTRLTLLVLSCNVVSIMQRDAGMRSSSHTSYNWMWTYAADKSMCMQVSPSCGPFHELIFIGITQLHNTRNNRNHQIQVLAILKECMHNHKYLNLCYQKYLWCLYQQQDGETALVLACKKEDLRSVELLLKASADPNHITNVSTTGKQSLLPFPFSFLNFIQHLNHVAIYQEQKLIGYSDQLCIDSSLCLVN